MEKEKINSEIIDALENKLKQYQENIIETLEKKYFEIEKLDVSDLVKKGFDFVGNMSGISFIDKLRTFYDGKILDDETGFWVINKWGGIGSFKNNENNKEKITKFKKALQKERLNIELFDVISSLSKIASFENHNDYFVYDSKAIFTLNWLILKSDLENPKFFPMPESRSQKLTTFNLNTIINLYYKDKIKNNDFKSLLLNKYDSYFIYCNLIKELNKRLFSNINNKPYYLEMLLFSIADNLILEDLKSSVQIKLKK